MVKALLRAKNIKMISLLNLSRVISTMKVMKMITL
jgi:hypothetical protein